MCKKTKFNHIALQCKDRNKAKIFYSEILGLYLEKSFTLDSDLSNEIFGINKKVDVDVYSNETLKFELFFDEVLKNQGFVHYCIEIESKIKFISKCKKYDVKTKIIDKNGKKLLFVNDFSNNLFEIKEA